MNPNEFALLCSFTAAYGCTPEQEEVLINAVSLMSIADREEFYYGQYPMPSAVYTKLSECCGEMGGYHRY